MTYIVWVGGIDDHYQTKEEAEQAVKEWREKGYDDVILENENETIDAKWQAMEDAKWNS